jgi:membrane-bound lytic murein transglycosylase F
MICKNQNKKKDIFVKSCLIFVLFLFCSCTRREAVQKENADLPRIMENGRLTVAANYCSADYFVFKGEPMGFHYEILQELGKYLDVKIEMITGKSFMENLQYLSEGKCDMMISELLTPEDSLLASNILPLYRECQVLVQRKPVRWKKMTDEELKQNLVGNPEDLNGKMVYASGWSSLPDGKDFVEGRHIRFTKLSGIESESLINLVADGELDYAVCSRSVARSVAGSHDNIDIETELGDLSYGWLARTSSHELREEISRWLSDFKKTSKYAVIHQKYHTGNVQAVTVNNEFFAGRTGKISEYDELFKKYSREIDWDWRLLASLVCQESRFKPQARSRSGAYGLMQMMPSTLQYFGIDTTASPEKHIAAGVAYIKYLDKMISPKVENKEERIKFVLASYNIGPGHIFDAQYLAEKYGKNAAIWDNNVDSFLLSKAEPKFYNDPEVRHGKCKGKETFAFVTQILERYEHYRNMNKIQ